jgi:ornithine carbamoyltransferase
LVCDELHKALRIAKELKKLSRMGKPWPDILRKKTFFMVFYASSTRTRAAFESAMTYLGGHAAYIYVSATRLKAEEATKDVAKMYEAYGDGIGVRILDETIDFKYGEGNKVMREYAEASKKPVINMLMTCFIQPRE